MRKSIFLKYFTIVAAITSICVILFSSILVINSRDQWIKEKNALLTRNTKTVKSILSSPNNSIRHEQMQMVVSILSESSDSTILVFNQGGYCKVATDSALSPEFNASLSKELIESVNDSDFSQIGTLDGLLSERCYVVGTRAAFGNITQGYVFAAVPMSENEAYIASTLGSIFWSALVVILISFVVTYIASLQMSKPLRRMAKVVKKIENSDFSSRIPVTTSDEIGLLAEALNKMIVSLSILEESHRDFISSISHEFKTPLQTISGFIDGMLDGTIKQDERKKYLMIVSDEAKRLSRLVNSMLQISRLENEQTKPLTKTTFNITDMVISVFLSFEHKINEKNIEIIGLDTLGPTSLCASKDLIYQVIYNLCENAIKFTPQAGQISVEIGTKDQFVVFKIRNSGDGLSNEEMVKIFDRFYKTDRSRSKDKIGMGFGLHIVKMILSLHKGKIEVSSVMGEYTQFDVYIPETEILAQIVPTKNKKDK